MDDEAAREAKRFVGLRYLLFCLCVLASLFPYACLVTYVLWLLYGNKDPSRLWLPIVYVTFVLAWIVPLSLRRESLKLRVLRGVFALLAPVIFPYLLMFMLFTSTEARNWITEDIGERLAPLVQQHEQKYGTLPQSPTAVVSGNLEWEVKLAKPMFFAHGKISYDPEGAWFHSIDSFARYFEPATGTWTTVEYYGDNSCG